MSLCKDCLVTARHEGTPAGGFQQIGGIDTYVSLPPAGTEYAKDKAVLFLTDVFGPRALHAQLLADDYARAGYQVYVPDYLNNDPVTEEMRATPGFDIMTDWGPRHTQAHTQPILDKVIDALRSERGIKTFGCTGYCFGGRYGVDLALSNTVASSVIAHPGLVTLDDFIALRKVSAAKFMIVSCEDDFSFGLELQAQVDEALNGWPNYERKFWKGCRHGFAVRADPKDDVARTAKEEAFGATVEWFKKTL
ncbi:dienelactone hydrolase endo-1,3,1,4-beta-D-glucanase [Exidia glandulosa HHB12029]|uniref:Dienelactone hydrolase endo-1,3,1,4-beta-D-glucanase n=1 Tax=Exidia glandulosa HHB12029 TaxID=1314781 RepID=A0A165Q557_EXIGL|nr:dienelactone hydrolase endo-1,3,1,4-beta-D-glucanase [Exidia glandulosa HHB12029]